MAGLVTRSEGALSFTSRGHEITRPSRGPNNRHKRVLWFVTGMIDSRGKIKKNRPISAE
jgi:hypothetical protein